MRTTMTTGWLRLVAAMSVALTLLLAMTATISAQSTPAATPAAGAISTPAITLEDDQAAIAVVHAASAAPAVDILVDDEVVLSGVEFGTVSEFLKVPSGDHNVKVVPAGGDASQAVIDSDVSLDSGNVYAVVAANGTDDGPELKAFEINNDPVSDGNTRIIAIHAAPTVDAIDISAAGGDPIISDLSYFDASDAADFMGTSAAFEIHAAGEEGVLNTLPEIQLEAGSSIAIVVTTDAQANPIALVVGTYPGQEGDEDQIATPVS
jgi:hypothetical protein